jgi:hypothetical protein
VDSKILPHAPIIDRMGEVHISKADARRFLLRALIGSLCLTALVAIFAIVAGRFEEAAVKVVLTALVIAFYSVTALAVANVMETSARLALAGWASAVLGLLVTAGLIWSNWDHYDHALWRWTWVFGVVSFSCAHAAALIARRRPADTPSIRNTLQATLVLIAVVAAMVVLPTALNFSDVGHGYARVVGALFVLDVLGTALLPIMRKIHTAGGPGTKR